MPAFTPETARLAGLKSVEVRKQREIEREAEALKPVEIPVKNESTEYLSRRIELAREQIERLHKLLKHETDPQALDRLAAALGRLSTMERELSMRPAPGTLKPTAPKAPKHTQLPPAPDVA